jgi:putative endonuclease
MTQNHNRWKVYIVKCSDGSLYTGCTTDVESRVETHNQGKGAKYTQGRLPVKLVYHEVGLTHSAALKREYQIKQLTHQEKEQLVEQKQ